MSTTAIDDDPMLTPEQVAAHLKTTKAGLYTLRSRGGGPPFARIGGRLLIRQSEYLAWLDKQSETK